MTSLPDPPAQTDPPQQIQNPLSETALYPHFNEEEVFAEKKAPTDHDDIVIEEDEVVTQEDPPTAAFPPPEIATDTLANDAENATKLLANDADEGLDANTPSNIRKSANWRVPIEEFRKRDPKYAKKRRVKQFYKEQNEFVDEIIEMHEDFDAEADETVPLVQEPEENGRDSDENAPSRRSSSATANDVVAEPVESYHKAISSRQNAAKGSSQHRPKHVSTLQSLKSRIQRTCNIEQFCLFLSFFSNVIIFTIKLTASIASGSLALVASTIDSSLDLATGFILFIANRLRHRRTSLDYLHYPLGKSRLEPVAYIIFACIVCTATSQMVITSCQTVVLGVINQVKGNDSEVPYVDGDTWFFWFSLGTLVVVAIWKSILYCICRPVKSSPSVQAYAQDHRNDVLFNSSLAIAVGCGSLSKYVWWLDPFFALLVSLFILQGWMRNIVEYVKKLVGLSADSKTLSKLTHLTFAHDPRILFIDTVRAMYVGLGLWVEVDIVLPEDMPLREAHDIGESLQKKIELQEDVERAWVHLDFEYSHSPHDEHKRPK